MLQTIHEAYEPFDGSFMKYGNLVRQACLARNSSVTYGGVTPLELAFARRPRDVLTPENVEPNQLTGNPTDQEVTARASKELANKADQEACQSDDLRRDLAARRSMSEHLSFWGKKYTTGLSTQPKLDPQVPDKEHGLKERLSPNSEDLWLESILAQESFVSISQDFGKL